MDGRAGRLKDFPVRHCNGPDVGCPLLYRSTVMYGLSLLRRWGVFPDQDPMPVVWRDRLG